MIALTAAALAVMGCTTEEMNGDPESPGKSSEEGYYAADPSREGGSGYTDYTASDGEYGGEGEPTAPSDGGIPGDGGEGEGDPATPISYGVLTAAEWNDLDHWDFWCQLMKWQPGEGQEGSGVAYDDNWNVMTFAQTVEYWGFCPFNRVAVQVNNAEGRPVSNVAVDLVSAGEKVWSARTDNRGRANCWVGLFQNTSQVNPDIFRIVLNGEEQEGAPEFSLIADGECKTNTYVISTKGGESKADVAFIVDATGSMCDEIAFLQEDLDDIISKVVNVGNVAIRTGSLFYRDVGDEYITRPSDFSTDFSVTREFIAQQQADGGGDYPEAVHTALEKTLTDLSWNDEARARIAFLILDAPAHHEEKVVRSLQESIAEFARRGINIIPVAASGIDKSCEFMLRSFAIGTGGTYVFLTTDSGVGGEHIQATVGDYEVEKLNDLIARLILEYVQ